MNPATTQKAQKLARAVARVADAKQGTLIIAPPALYIERVQRIHKLLAAQDISEYEQGAYTGQMSARMAHDAHIQYSIVGHSERRKYQHETDEQIAQKIVCAQTERTTPIICIGEQTKMSVERAWGVIKKQIDHLLPSLKKGSAYIFAYEPVWAVGGDKKIAPQDASHMIYRIKLYLRAQKHEIPVVVYGGSVNCENIDSLVYYKNNIDGFLVGSASVKEKEIKTIIKKIYGSY